MHRTKDGHSKDVIPERFAETHRVEVIAPRNHDPVMPDYFQALSDLDRLLAQWEWRSEPTPWAILKSRAAADA
jgi:hypothetical protein